MENEENGLSGIQMEAEKLEIDILLETIFRRYGYDFRNYARASIRRRILNYMQGTSYHRVSEMIPRLIYDETFFQAMLQDFSITVTEMFRDPEFFKVLREKIVPYLKTYPFIKIWHAGCATGEEAYSLAILLKEEGLYERATIFATDFNDNAIAKAREGIYEMANVKKFTKNYQEAGGKHSFSEYYHANYESVIMKSNLRENITFANHNLVTDTVFGEMHLILCRNVLIYFDKQLQDRVLELFDKSLVRNGFLCLGNRENIRFSTIFETFTAINEKWRVYQRAS
jgi:chemotaxis protein methyltransferase CheR